jgi:hypothetical protein
MDKRQRAAFKTHCQQVWTFMKAVIAPEFHPLLRKTMAGIIRAETKEFDEFVALMETNKEDHINKKLQAAATYDRADELQDIDEVVVTHQCHYCGDMYHISDLSGAKEGLICYKCRHEMENRD